MAEEGRIGRLHLRCKPRVEEVRQVYLRSQEANHKTEEVDRMDSHRVGEVGHHENHLVELVNDLRQERRFVEAWHRHWYSAKMGLEDDTLDRELDPPKALL